MYTSKDIRNALRLFTGLSYERWHFVDNDIEVFFRDTGHILGSASITLQVLEEGQTIYLGFSGDIGRPERPILHDPKPMPPVDYLICESTYGHKEHQNYTADINDLLYIVKETCLLNEGKLLIPAFSVGKTQELIYMLDQLEIEGKLPKIPVYVDSPLAINAVEVFRMHPECYDDQLHDYMLIGPNPFGFSDLNYVRRRALANRLAASKEPCIIISSSGMMISGRVRRHLYHLLGQAQNTILSVGYCAPNILGGRLLGGVNSVNLYGKKISVRARIQPLVSFSAHADRREILQFLSLQHRVKNLFLVHRKYRSLHKFRTFLQQNGFEDVQIPSLGESYTLVD